MVRSLQSWSRSYHLNKEWMFICSPATPQDSLLQLSMEDLVKCPHCEYMAFGGDGTHNLFRCETPSAQG